jgi:hypothetical protein
MPGIIIGNFLMSSNFAFADTVGQKIFIGFVRMSQILVSLCYNVIPALNPGFQF